MTISKESEIPISSKEYLGDIEEGFKGISEEKEMLDLETGPETTAYYEIEEETEELEDHMEVSSGKPEEYQGEMEAPEYGLEGMPPITESELEFGLKEGYDEKILEMDREDVEALEDETYLLDAWYAEFADPATVAMVRQQPNLSRTTAEVVIGQDDRVQITNTTAFPWRAVCSLKITAKDGSRWIGTGWLVGPRTVITAGHVVYMHSRGGWARSIEVIPGRNGSVRPYESCTSSYFHSVKGWTKKKKRSHDYGAIILPSSCQYGTRLGYFGYANLNRSSLKGLKVNLSGYPGDKPSGTQWWHARRIKWVTVRTIVYNIDTAGGQSGSPVWWLTNGKRYAVGIHTNGSPSGNSATRITKPVFDNIKQWKNNP
ncbi:trypsin-like serine peptidase [Methanosarcina sp. T3]|uniref:trypsin-like serine peptidase n=1 Tax=Methanosarcina sp. T3 TaxID=3439062 RepID=UPI003F841409